MFATFFAIELFESDCEQNIQAWLDTSFLYSSSSEGPGIHAPVAVHVIMKRIAYAERQQILGQDLHTMISSMPIVFVCLTAIACVYSSLQLHPKLHRRGTNPS